jgi:hypothetical protein
MMRNLICITTSLLYTLKTNYNLYFFRSLGLAVPPRIRFLQRAQKQKGQQIKKPENLGKESDFGVLPSSDALNPKKFRNTDSSGSSDDESHRKQGTRLTQQSLAFGNGENTFASHIISQILTHCGPGILIN